MQLTRKRVLISVAVVTLGAIATTAAAQGRVLARVSQYTERRGSLRTDATSPEVEGQVKIGPVTAALGWEADFITSATIPVVDAPVDVDGITSATQMSDERHAFRGGVAWEVSRAVTLRAGYRYGFERDYRGHAPSIGLSWTSEAQLTTLDFDYTLSIDGVCDTSLNDGVSPTERLALANANGCFSDRSDNRVTQSRVANLGRFSLTQVLRPEVIVQLAASFLREDGFLSSPYREVWLGTLAAQEHHPDRRMRAAGSAEVRIALEDLRAFVALRLDASHDDWGITSGAGTLSWTQKLGAGFRLGFRIRGYTQSSAAFFSDDYVSNPRGAYFTGDRELSAMHAWGGGLRLSYRHPGAGVLRGFRAVLLADATHNQYPAFSYSNNRVPSGAYVVVSLLVEAELGRAPESP